jgi:hypothetical protein
MTTTEDTILASSSFIASLIITIIICFINLFSYKLMSDSFYNNNTLLGIIYIILLFFGLYVLMNMLTVDYFGLLLALHQNVSENGKA